MNTTYARQFGNPLLYSNPTEGQGGTAEFEVQTNTSKGREDVFAYKRQMPLNARL